MIIGLSPCAGERRRMSKKRRLAAVIANKGVWVTLPLVFFVTFAIAIAQEREEPELPEANEYINLPDIVVKGTRWRLSDEEQQKLWRRELEELKALEDEQAERKKHEGAVASGTSKSGRWKVDFLPRYNPEKKFDDLGADEERVEVTQFIRIGF